jgi:hypothetical protein
MHKRRSGQLRDDSSVLRVYDGHDEGWLHLLRLDEQHAGLLLLLRSIARRSRPFGAKGAGTRSPLEKAETAAR